MTEIVQYQPPRNTIATVSPPEADSWIAIVGEVAKFADYVAMTEFVPAALRGKPAAVTAAILSGREIGLGPMAAMKHMQMVEGTPALSAEMARALVQARGHEIRFREMTTTRCVVEGRRRGEDEWTTVTWTMDDAKRAGLLDAGKSGRFRPGWSKYPRRQLIARASAELCHLKFADCLNGMPFLEELEDEGLGQPAEAVDGASPEAGGPAKPRTAQRKTRQAVLKPVSTPTVVEGAVVPPADAGPAGPPLPGEPGYDGPADVPVTVLVTPEQLTKLHTVFTKHGIEDRAERLDIASRIANRPLTTSKELTKQDASAVIDTLERVAVSGRPFTEFLAQLYGIPDDDQAANEQDAADEPDGQS